MDSELLNDLNDLDDDEENEDGIDQGALHDLDSTSGEEDEDLDNDDNTKITEIKSYQKDSSLRNSERYKNHMKAVHDSLSNDKIRVSDGKSFKLQSEHDGEYKIIIATNKLMVELSDEMYSIHKFLIDIYKKKFPELDALIPTALDYARVVSRMKNEMDMTVIDLDDLLPPTTGIKENVF